MPEAMIVPILAPDVFSMRPLLDAPRNRTAAIMSVAAELPEGRLTTTQLAEQLDRGTLDLAVKTVPVAWWEARLGTTAHADDDVAEANGRGPVGPTRGRV